MKRIILALLCLSFSVQGSARNDASLVVKGYFLETMNVEYKVELITKDTCWTVLEGHGAFDFEINLETLCQYRITFDNGEFAKTLIIKADAPGIFEVDVDFGNTNSAVLAYNYHKRKYKLKGLPNPEYYVSRDIHQTIKGRVD